MKKFVFVILHYFTIDDTKRCVESILDKGKRLNLDIIIVDNASPNNTGIELEKIYANKDNIHIIISKKNLGFANGNNLGFKYAKSKLNPDFIIMCNNDTYLIQEDFFDLIIKEFNDSNFSVLGPKIVLPQNNINPIRLYLPDIETLKKQLLNIKFEYIVNMFGINEIYMKTRKTLKKILEKLNLKKIEGMKEKEVKQQEIEGDTENRYEDIILHGSFLIFSKSYIEKFDGLNNKTFFYREEELLALRLKRSNMKSVYNPEIQVFHNEDSATNAITQNDRNKKLFIYKNQIKSIKILIREMKS